MQRRTFLKGSLASSTVAIAVGAGLISPSTVLAAWPKAAFSAKNMQDALTAVALGGKASASNKIKLKAPDIAENGAVVPVTVSTSIPGITDIAIIVEKNGTPLAANFKLSGSSKGFVATRIKMGKTSNVIAVVKAGGKSYSARKDVKVTIGGCGG